MEALWDGAAGAEHAWGREAGATAVRGSYVGTASAAGVDEG